MLKNLNFILVLATIAALAAGGAVFIYGSGYSWIQSTRISEWRQTLLYQEYVNNMNLAVMPSAVILVVLLGLCIPKRLFSGARLLQAMGTLLLLTGLAFVMLGPQSAMGFLLATAILIQLAVIGLTATGSRRLSYESQSFFVQIGSALLHLGLVVFLLDFIVLGESSVHITVFWAAATLIAVGMIFCFYAAEFSRLGKFRAQPDSQTQEQ